MNNPIQPIDTEELSKKEKRKAYYEANKEKIRVQGLIRRQTRTEEEKAKVREYHKSYRSKHIQSINTRRKLYRMGYHHIAQRWFEENKEKNRAYAKQWREANKDYHKKRREADPLYKMVFALRNNSSRAFKRIGQSKPTDTTALLGCSWEEAKTHIESLFTEGMSWNNYGSWHIDHIVPIASATTLEEARALNHISNLQPLWAKDNLTKGAKGKRV